MLQNASLIKFFFGKLQLFLTDSQKSRIHLVYLQIFLSVCWKKKFKIFFFAWNVLKHKVKTKNSRNSTFFSKFQFPPVFEKHLEIFRTKNLSRLVYAINFYESQRGKIQTLLELSSHSHIKKEGKTAAIAGHRRRGGCSKP